MTSRDKSKTQSDDQKKVKHIAEKKQELEKKPPKIDLYEQVANAMSFRERSNLPLYPTKYYCVEQEHGKRQILHDTGGGVVEYCASEAVVCAVQNFCRRELTGWPWFRGFSTIDHEKTGKFWLRSADAIPEPKLIRERSDKGLCFHRLEFDIDKNGFFEQHKHPLFTEFLNRCSNAEALMAFIGSLFFDNADRQQYLWVYGMGQNGKSSLLRFLGRLLGPASAAKVTPSKEDKFWTHGLLGKRLVQFPDCSDGRYPSSQFFKMLSGNDAVPVEEKGKMAVNAQLNCKFIFASNDKPEISGQKSDLRRAIFCEVDPIATNPDPKYDTNLWAEAPYIAGTCVTTYDRLCGIKGNIPIPVDEADIKLLADENACEWELLFNEFFEVEKGTWFSGATLAKIMQEKFGHQYHNSRKEFRKWLKYEKHIWYRTIRISDTETKKGYLGARLTRDYYDA